MYCLVVAQSLVCSGYTWKPFDENNPSQVMNHICNRQVGTAASQWASCWKHDTKKPWAQKRLTVSFHTARGFKKVMSIKTAELLILLFTCQYTQEFNWIIKKVYPIILIRKDKRALSIALSATVKMLSVVQRKKRAKPFYFSWTIAIPF